VTFRRDADDTTNDALPESVTAWLATAHEQRPPASEALAEWLARDSNNAIALEEFDTIWRLSQTPPPPAAWHTLKARIDREKVPVRLNRPRALPNIALRRAAPPKRFASSSLLRFAAAATVIIGVAVATNWSRIRPSGATDPKMTTLTVPPAAMSTVQLAGGVSVRLNSVSTLSYSLPRDGIQEVRLDGEGYFEVPHDPKRVFRVVTEMGTVTDLGTQFNINARSGKVAVTVVDGTAELESAGQKVSLRAGQTSYALKGAAPAQPADVNVAIALSWTEGRLVFRDEPLEKVAEEMTRRYGVPFTVDDDLRDFKLSAAMSARESADAAAALCAAASARCVPLGGGWSIVSSAK
jgi:transmembrane sensor